jgi:hypothetical protein
MYAGISKKRSESMQTVGKGCDTSQGQKGSLDRKLAESMDLETQDNFFLSQCYR